MAAKRREQNNQPVQGKSTSRAEWPLITMLGVIAIIGILAMLFGGDRTAETPAQTAGANAAANLPQPAQTQPGQPQPAQTGNPEPWQYDPVLDRYWHEGHGHWHNGTPPPPSQRNGSDSQTTTTTTTTPPQQQQQASNITDPEPWQYDSAGNRHWHEGHGHWHQGPPPPPDERDNSPAQTTTTTTTTQAEPQEQASTITDPEPWEYDEAAGRHWHEGHGHWHQGPPPPPDQRDGSSTTSTTVVGPEGLQGGTPITIGGEGGQTTVTTDPEPAGDPIDP